MQTPRSILVTGASSGLGYAVASGLLEKGCATIVTARSTQKLESLKEKHPSLCTIIAGDLTQPQFIEQLVDQLPTTLSGVFINAGGPPAARLSELTLEQWDEAYRLLIRWKIQLTQLLLPLFIKKKYGRIVFSESTSVTRPVENLGLSSSLRMAIIGYMKTLVLENQGSGLTFNMLAPGFHETQAVERLFKKKSEQQNISRDAAKEQMQQTVPTRSMGQPEDFASLALWLLSPQSNFITGQILHLDGGTSV